MLQLVAVNAPQLLTVAEVASRARVSMKTVYRAIQRGDLAASRLATNCLRISEQAFEDWVERSQTRPTSSARQTRHTTIEAGPASRTALRKIEREAA